MTRSIFDPDGGETDASGNQNLGPDAGNLSHMPPDAVDGKAGDESDAAADPTVDAAHANMNEVAVDADEAAQRLAEMQVDVDEAEDDTIET